MATAADWASRSAQSFQSARLLRDTGHYQDAISRAYYCGYYAGTAILYLVGLTPPDADTSLQGQAWRHRATQDLLKEHGAKLIKDTDFKNRLVIALQTLYRMRETADYTVDSTDHESVTLAIRSAGQLTKVAQECLK